MGRCDNTCRKMFVRCAVRKLTGRYSTEEGKSHLFVYFDGHFTMTYYYRLQNYYQIARCCTTPCSKFGLVFWALRRICAVNNIFFRCLNLHLDNLLVAAVRDVLQIGSDIPASLLPDRGDNHRPKSSLAFESIRP